MKIMSYPEKKAKIGEDLKALNEKESESQSIIDKLKQVELKFDLLLKEKDEKN